MRIFIILMVLGAIAYVAVRWAAQPALSRYIGPKFAASFVIMTFMGMFGSPLLLSLTCIFVMVALTRDRLDAVCRFILLSALIPGQSWGLVVAGSFLGRASAPDMLAVGLALATMIRPDRPRVAYIRGFTIEDGTVLFLFAALHIASDRLTGGVTGLARELLEGGLRILLPYVLLRRHLRNVNEFRIVIGCIAAVSAILSIYAIYEAANGWSLFASINENLGADKVGLRNLLLRGGTLRASTTMSGALMLGCYLGIGWIAMICSRDLVRGNILWLAGCALVLLGELSTQSRGGLFCAALAALIVLAANRRIAFAAATGAGLAVAGGMLYLAAGASTKIAGFLNISTARVVGEDYDYRQVLFRRGMEEAAKHRWTGTDISSVIARLGDIRQGEGIVDFVNTYLYLYLVMGIVAFLALVVMLVLVTHRAIALSIPREARDLMIVRGFAIAAWVSMLITLSFMSFIDRMPILFVIPLVAIRLCRHQTALLKRKSIGQKLGRPG